MNNIISLWHIEFPKSERDSFYAALKNIGIGDLPVRIQSSIYGFRVQGYQIFLTDDELLIMKLTIRNMTYTLVRDCRPEDHVARFYQSNGPDGETQVSKIS